MHGDHTGQLLWRTPKSAGSTTAQAIALADLNHDGSAEIIAGDDVFDAQGVLQWTATDGSPNGFSTPTAADLDGDGYLEAIWGAVAYRHDGTPYYRNTEILTAIENSTGSATGHYFAIADLDGDERPELVVSTATELFVLDRNGETLRSLTIAPGPPLFDPSWTSSVPAIHDLDGDGLPEIVLRDDYGFTAFDAGLIRRWSMPVTSVGGTAACAAFDFLGDGSAEALYGNEQTSGIFAGLDGDVIFMQPRTGFPLIQYPSVADVDNDGSADILIASNAPGEPLAGGLRVISDRMRRWIPARRVFNQDTYHVTNVNEDGTIPVHEAPHWKLNNSFRAQAQVNADGTFCVPKP